MPIELFVMPDENGRTSPSYEAARAAVLAVGLEIDDEQQIGDPAGGRQILMVSGFVVSISRKRFADLRSACDVAVIRLNQLAPSIAAVRAEPSVMRVNLDIRLDCGRPQGWRADRQLEMPPALREAATRCGVWVSVEGAGSEWIAHWRPT